MSFNHGRLPCDSLAAEPAGIEARSGGAAMQFRTENRFTLFLELLYCTS